jgi:hypothetical protein
MYCHTVSENRGRATSNIPGEGGEFEGETMNPSPIRPLRVGRKLYKDPNLGLSCGHDVGIEYSERKVGCSNLSRVGVCWHLSDSYHDRTHPTQLTALETWVNVGIGCYIVDGRFLSFE